MSPRPLPPQPSLEHLKKQAKGLLKAHKAGDPEAAARFRASLPPLSKASDAEVARSKLSLRDAQMVIAREYEFESWADLRSHVAGLEKAETLQVHVHGILSSFVNYQRVVVLRVQDSNRYLPIWIGPSEADSIALKLHDVSVPRPLTHDLLDLTIADLGANVVRVVVSDLRDDTFYATIALQINGKTIVRDSRPSDAIALAVGSGAPIFASEAVLEKAGVQLKAGESLDQLTKREGKLVSVKGNLSERARDAISVARKEARRLNHDAIGTEHLLLGLVSETEGVAAKALVSLGVELDKVTSAVESILRPGEGTPSEETVLTPRAARVLDLAGSEAHRLKHHWFGTEHLLIGLMREGRGTAAGLLKGMGVTLKKVRTETLRILEEKARGDKAVTA